MGKFIELTRSSNARPVLVNVENIAYLQDRGDGHSPAIYFIAPERDGQASINVVESYSKVKQAIRDASDFK